MTSFSTFWTQECCTDIAMIGFAENIDLLVFVSEEFPLSENLQDGGITIHS